MRVDVALRRRLSPTFALDVAFTMDLGAGHRVGALFGPSGCGKTTTLAMLGGLVRPDAGRVEIGDRVLFDASAATDVPPHERAVGLVQQDGLLFPHLDVRGNLAFGERRRRGRPCPAFDDVVDVLRLGPVLSRSVRALSGGERQRTALARALLSAPRLLLLDEPVSALDEALRWEALALVESVTHAFAVPAIYVSHQRDEVLRLASHVARMEAGRVVAVGTPQTVLAGDSDSGAVPNLFRVVVAESGADHAALPGGGTIQLPCEGRAGASVWCRLSSGAVALERPGTTPTTSARNRLRGRVVAVDTAAHRARVAVDVGTPLHVDVTPETVRALELRPGADVVCVFKVHSLEVLP